MSGGVSELSPPPEVAETSVAAEDEGRGRGRRRWGATGSWVTGLRAFQAPLVYGLLVRLLLAPLTSWPDMNNWLAAASEGAYHSPLYASPGFSYPGAWGHVLQMIGQLASFCGLPPSSFASFEPSFSTFSNIVGSYVLTPTFDLVLKAPLIAADAATALLAAALVTRLTGNPARARRTFSLVFLNPVTILSSAVMGSFDVVIALCILACIYGVLVDRPALAGCAVGIGFMTKIVPVFIVPLLLAFMVIRQPASKWREKIAAARSGLLVFLCSAAGAALIIMLPEIVNGSVGRMWHAVTLRQTGIPLIGGINLLALGEFRGLGSLLRIAAAHAADVRDLNYACIVLVVAASIAALVRRKAGDAASLVFGVLAIFSATFLTTPLAQPLYFLWLIPLAAVVVGSEDLRGRWLFLPSLLPVAFVLALTGPSLLLSPLVVSANLFNPADIARWSADWVATRPGLIANHAEDDWLVLLSAAGVLAEISLLVVAFKRMGRTSATDGTSPSMADVSTVMPNGLTERQQVDRASWNPAGYLASLQSRAHRRRAGDGRAFAAALPTVVVFALVLVASMVESFTTGGATGSFHVSSASYSPGRLTLRISGLATPGQQSLRLVAFPLRNGDVVRRILVYEPRLSDVYTSSPTVAAELGPHLAAAAHLRMRGLGAHVEVVGPKELAKALGELADARSTVIVNVTSALPAAVFRPPSVDLVKPWLQAGGTLFWVGTAIGYRSSVGWQGESAIFGVHNRYVVTAHRIDVDAAGTQPSPFARALGIEWTALWFPLQRNAVFIRGGVDLGWTTGSATSLGAVPVGRGRVVLFAGPSYNVATLTDDLVTLLLSRAYEATPRAGVRWAFLPLSAMSGKEGTWTMHLGGPRLGHGGLVEVYASDPNPAGVMAASCLMRIRTRPAKSTVLSCTSPAGTS